MRILETPPQLAGHAPVADGFGDRAWFEAWYEAFAPAAKLFRISLPGTEVQPTFIEGAVKVFRRPFRFLRAPVNGHTPRYGWKLNHLPDPSEVSRCLFEALKASRCRGIEINLLLEEGTTLQLLRLLSTTGQWVVSVEEADRSLLTDVDGDWDAFRRTLPSKLTQNLNRRENKLRQLGRFEFLEAGQCADWINWFEKGLELEAAGWKGREGSAILRRPNEARFYRKMAESAARDRRLRLFITTLDDRVIAFRLTVIENGILFILKTAYDETLARCGPGGVLLRLILKECFADPSIQTVDMVGSADWILPWATRTERLVRVRLVPTGSLAGYLLRAEMTAKHGRSLLMDRWSRSRHTATVTAHRHDM